MTQTMVQIENRENSCEHLCNIGFNKTTGLLITTECVLSAFDHDRIVLFNFCPFCGQELNVKVLETDIIRFRTKK